MKITNEGVQKKQRSIKKSLVVFFAITIFVSLLMFFIPHIIVSFTPSVKIIFPDYSEINRDIYVDGVVEQASKKDIITELPIVPDEILVDVGDTIKKDQVIATIDKQATQAALFSMVSAVNLIPAEYVDAISSISASIPDNFVAGQIPNELKATADGVVTSMSLVSGAISTPKSAVCTISKVDELRLNMNVGELDANLVKEGDDVVFSAMATGDEEYHGTVTKIFPVASKVLSGTSQKTVVGVYIKPNQEYQALKPGYSVSGTIKKQTDEQKMMIAYQAIGQDEKNNEFVYCYQNSRAVKKYIKTGEEFANGVVIESGLTQTDAVISNPSLIKSDDSFVRIEGNDTHD